MLCSGSNHFIHLELKSFEINLFFKYEGLSDIRPESPQSRGSLNGLDTVPLLDFFLNPAIARFKNSVELGVETRGAVGFIRS